MIKIINLSYCFSRTCSPATLAASKKMLSIPPLNLSSKSRVNAKYERGL